MAHEIKKSDTMFSARGKTPWHGLGTTIDGVPTMAEAIKLSGLDWTVRVEPTFRRDGTECTQRVCVRESDGRELGSVGPMWSPIQNLEAFAAYQPLVDEGIVTLETAGSLRNGERVWILARLAGSAIEVADGDTVDRFVLFAHGHDGKLAIRCGFTLVRVVCANTLGAALLAGKSSGLAKIFHFGNALESVKAVLDGIRKACSEGAFEAVAKRMQQLAKLPIRSADQIADFVAAVYGSKERGVQERAEKRQSEKVEEITRLFESGTGSDLTGSKGTAWGLYNALTEYETHVRGKDAALRAERVTTGDSQGLLARGLDVAYVMGRGIPLEAVMSGDVIDRAAMARISAEGEAVAASIIVGASAVPTGAAATVARARSRGRFTSTTSPA